MDEQQALRRLIRSKLQAGRLPPDRVTRVWGSPSDGETCDVCDTVLTKDQLVLEGITRGRRSMQFHVACFQLWETERRALREGSG
jgi:hypothetical protein